MGKHLVQVSINSKELEEVMAKVDEARQALMDAVNGLSRLGLLTIDSEEAASGN